ncbi:putative histidine kinase-like ATPase [Vibrio phage 424E50-1]|nr:putative histidine kinase-like ATPase [Vibrio phage 424E50-1]
METFELTTNVDNVHEWTYLEGCREVIQGFLDNPKGGDWNYDPEEATLLLTNPDTKLERKVLLAGFSTKRDESESRGKFGDGLTSAICCLLREGYEVIIENSDITWKPTIGWSDIFEHEVIVVEEYRTPYHNEDYKVYIKGLRPDEMDKVIANTLPLQTGERNLHKTPTGDILLDEEYKGRIYVGGLFICNFNSEYGFDFKPHCFELDRDRKSLNPFDIKWACKDMWSHVGRNASESDAQIVITAMTSNDSSMEHLRHTTCTVSSEVEKAAEEVYNSEYDGKLVASDWEEAEDLRKAGNEVVLVKSASLVNVIRRTDSYRSFNAGAKKVKSVQELLDAWKEDWDAQLTLEALDAYVEMSEKVVDKT